MVISRGFENVVEVLGSVALVLFYIPYLGVISLVSVFLTVEQSNWVSENCYGPYWINPSLEERLWAAVLYIAISLILWTPLIIALTLLHRLVVRSS